MMEAKVQEEFLNWLHSAPNCEFHSIEGTWSDEATFGFTVDFAIIKEEEDDA
tara:strand:- start:393 stop:548 length:156 start_codon:yes stop_codon:yes gene_type:complete